jgi:hypothetical protein
MVYSSDGKEYEQEYEKGKIISKTNWRNDKRGTIVTLS